MVVSLTVTPMICAHYIKQPTSDRATRFDRLVEGTLSRIVAFYTWTLRAVLGFPFLTLSVFFATLALTVVLYIKIPKGYFPIDDSGLIVGASQSSSDTSFQSMTRFQRQLADVIESDDAVAAVGSILGSMTANRGLFFISLKPPQERAGLTTQLVIDRLRKKLEAMPGVRLYMFAAQDVRAGGRQSSSDYQYTVSSVDVDLLRKWAPIVAKRMETVEGITDISTDRDAAGLQLTLKIDRNAAAALGVRVKDIDDALNNAFAQRQISIVYTQRNQYMVVLEIDPKFQNDPSNLERIFVAGANDAQVPLSAVVRYDRSLASLAINHTQSIPSATVSFNLAANAPKTRFIFAHIGGANFRFWNILVLARTADGFALDNVNFDISGTVLLAADSPIEKEFVWTLRNVGVDHVMLGSDYPQISLARMVEALEKLDLTSEEKTAILSGNARRIFGAAGKKN